MDEKILKSANMHENENVCCAVCGKFVYPDDEFFAITDDNSKSSLVICRNCAETVTPMDLFLSGKISMANSEDDAIEIEGTVLPDDTVVDATPEEVEKFFTSDEPAFNS